VIYLRVDVIASFYSPCARAIFFPDYYYYYYYTDAPEREASEKKGRKKKRFGAARNASRYSKLPSKNDKRATRIDRGCADASQTS